MWTVHNGREQRAFRSHQVRREMAFSELERRIYAFIVFTLRKVEKLKQQLNKKEGAKVAQLLAGLEHIETYADKIKLQMFIEDPEVDFSELGDE